MNGEVEDVLSKLEKTLQRLGEALAEDSSNALIIDGTIQRLEFVFELTWKTLKLALEAEGFTCRTPRETLKTAFQAGWISDEELWLQMLDDCNRTSHTYDEPMATQIYEDITSYYPEITKLAKLIRDKHPQPGDDKNHEHDPTS